MQGQLQIRSTACYFVLKDSDDEEEDRRLEIQRRKEKEKRRDEQDKYRSGSRGKPNRKNEEDHLDPMDPAAYSDVARYVYFIQTIPLASR